MSNQWTQYNYKGHVDSSTYKLEEARGRSIIEYQICCLCDSTFCPMLFLSFVGVLISVWLAAKKDVDDESAEARKQVRRSKSTKRSRAAEVHNLSERVSTIITLANPHLLSVLFII